MRVLIVTGIFPPDHGGPATYVSLIADGIKKQGHDVVAVITLSDRTDYDDSHYGFPVIRLRRGSFRLFRWLQTILTIAFYARHSDVVFMTGLVLEGILATKYLIRRPAVVRVPGDLIWEKARAKGYSELDLGAFQRVKLTLPWRVLRWLQGWYTAKADVVIVPSRYLAQIVKGWGIDSNKIHVIYNAVRTHAFVRENATHLYDIVTVARLVPLKGLRELIEIASELGLRLRVIGEGPLRDELETLARQRGAQVTFAGHVAHDRIPDEIRSARLFVLNSSYEGLPHVVLEAKAAGVAVLATSAGGTPETIHHGVDGWLIPVNDKAALAEGIRRLLGDDELRARLAQSGLRQVAEQFNPAVQLQATVAVLAGVCR